MGNWDCSNQQEVQRTCYTNHTNHCVLTHAILRKIGYWKIPNQCTTVKYVKNRVLDELTLASCHLGFTEWRGLGIGGKLLSQKRRHGWLPKHLATMKGNPAPASAVQYLADFNRFGAQTEK